MAGDAKAKGEEPVVIKSTQQILREAGKRALGGGLPGAAAMGVQVCSLMWLRTTMNYQYRYGSGTIEAVKTLYADGGIRRFYRGVGPAMFQGPLSRFGDTAANAGALSLLNQNPKTKDLPVAAKTMVASTCAGLWRINLMPIDACKTILQVEGAKGLQVLRAKVAKSGFTVLYAGAGASFGATFAGHFPWFFTFNYMQGALPAAQSPRQTLLRNAACGFSASVVSDCVSNSIRVVKTTKQTSEVAITYPEAVRGVIAKDGLIGLFGRGLRTRIMTNGLSGMLFGVLWKHFEKLFANNVLDKEEKKDDKK